jgi:exoribonuclease R
MNYHCAKDLFKYRTGIFRSTIIKSDISLPNYLPDNVNQFIKIWNSSCAQYIDISKTDIGDENITRHDLLSMDAYVHITSPIRRLADLLNIIQFQKNHNLITLSDDSMQFYDKWIQQIDYINVTMRAIRKIQSDCSLLATCHNNPSTLEKNYDGYCFDKLVRSDGLYLYIVYLPELKMASRITMRENLDNYSKKQFKLFLFNDEEKFKRKIRLQIRLCTAKSIIKPIDVIQKLINVALNEQDVTKKEDEEE